MRATSPTRRTTRRLVQARRKSELSVEVGERRDRPRSTLADGLDSKAPLQVARKSVGTNEMEELAENRIEKGFSCKEMITRLSTRLLSSRTALPASTPASQRHAWATWASGRALTSWLRPPSRHSGQGGRISGRWYAGARIDSAHDGQVSAVEVGRKVGCEESRIVSSE